MNLLWSTICLILGIAAVVLAVMFGPRVLENTSGVVTMPFKRPDLKFIYYSMLVGSVFHTSGWLIARKQKGDPTTFIVGSLNLILPIISIVILICWVSWSWFV